MTIMVKWTDGGLKTHETAIEDWRVCEKVTYYGVYSADEIVRMCLDSVVKEGVMSIEEIWYEDD